MSENIEDIFGRALSIQIIIMSEGRIELLSRCLDSLQSSQKGIVLPIRLGISGNHNNLKQALRQKIQSLGVEVIDLPQGILPSAGRNILLNMGVQSKWVLFLDDDAALGSEYFEVLGSLIHEFSKSRVLGGPNLTPGDSRGFAKISGLVLQSQWATFHTHPRYIAKGPVRSVGEESLILCNLVVDSSLLKETPFHEGLSCCEESHLLECLRAKGISFIHSPRLLVIHERRGSPISFFRQTFKYGKGRGELTRLIPQTLKTGHLIPPLCILYIFLIVAFALYRVLFGLSPGTLFLFPLLLYGVLLTYFLVKYFRYGVYAPLALFCIHCGYGFGFLWGIFRGPRRESVARTYL